MERAVFDILIKESPDKLFEHINQLEAQVIALKATVDKLEARVVELEARLNKNSSNSSKPPSSDMTHKNRSLRRQSGKKNGGQHGHKGSTLKRSETPDTIVVCELPEHCSCGSNLEEATILKTEKRQEFDIPPIALQVTEYHSETRECRQCGKIHTGSFPEHISNVVQYGLNIKRIAVYLRHYQLLPIARLAECFNDVFSLPLSEGTLQSICCEAGKNAEQEQLKHQEIIKQSAVIHCDETGFYVKGKRWWLHVASTATHTHYHVSEKRGTEAMNDAGILPEFSGVAVHDHWKPYYRYSCRHAACNVHILRELKAFSEQHHKWADMMSATLLAIKKAVDTAKAEAKNSIDEQLKLTFIADYRRIINDGLEAEPPPELRTGKRGKTAQTKTMNMLERLRNYEEEILRFMNDFRVPFSNNQAEQDVRMTKVQQKISGCFRTLDGAKHFAAIRGIISTAKKQSENILKTITIACFPKLIGINIPE